MIKIFHNFANISFFFILFLTRVAQGKLCRFESIIENQNELIDESDLELHQTLMEIESLKLENAQFRKKLHDKDLENIYHMKMRMELERECESLRTKLMLAAKKRADGQKSPQLSNTKYIIPSLAIEKNMSVIRRKERKAHSLHKFRNSIHKECNVQTNNRNLFESNIPLCMQKEMSDNIARTIANTELTLAAVARESHLSDQGIIPNMSRR